MSIENNKTHDSIPPIRHNGEFVTSDVQKADLFNDYFISISSVNNSNTDINIEPRITDDNNLSDIDITEQEVLDQINLLDTSKSYGPDGLPPRIIKEGGKALSKIIQKLFSISIDNNTFPLIWKSANVVPLYKKDNRDAITNYRPISLLSSVSKIFEKIIFKHIYNHFKDNFIISDFQSGFLPKRSTTTQLIDVYHTFCQAIDNEKEVRVVFLDISKAFDRVWHKGLLYKLHRPGISGNLLKWLQSYLSDRRQRVIINGQNSDWKNVTAGVPQGSVLGPLLFLLYINDLSYEIQNCNIRFFADDTCLFINIDNRTEAAERINDDLIRVKNWADKWLVNFSPTKTKSLIISNKHDRQSNPAVYFDNLPITEVNNHTYLGLKFSYNLKWNDHIEDISVKATKRLNMMLPLKYKISRKTLEIMYKTLVQPVMEYAIVVWGGTFDTTLSKLEEINVSALRLISGATSNSNISNLYKETALNSFYQRRDIAMLKMFYKIKHNLAPDYLAELLPPERYQVTQYSLRNNNTIEPPFARLETFKRSFIPYSIRLWNAAPDEIKNADSFNNLKKALTNSANKNTLYYYGKRWSNIHHARLRLGCSGLNYDLFNNLHVINSPFCSCGTRIVETSHHFLMECPKYLQLREQMKNKIIRVSEFQYDVLLHGNNDLNYKDNCLIFDAVHEFIINTSRFR